MSSGRREGAPAPSLLLHPASALNKTKDKRLKTNYSGGGSKEQELLASVLSDAYRT